jgi:class 3 adenylate cyclase
MASILFADIVGFTPLAESRDPEEVRELLGRYFETAREIVQRYGGALEKFIGTSLGDEGGKGNQVLHLDETAGLPSARPLTWSRRCRRSAPRPASTWRCGPASPPAAWR